MTRCSRCVRDTRSGNASAKAVLALALLIGPALSAAGPEQWVPARWEGGPAEAARRDRDKAPPKPALREAIAGWYNASTLGLLEGTPINCLLITFSTGADPEVEREQRRLVKEYTRLARARGIAVLGIVHPGADPTALAAAAADAQLDGLVLAGDFPGGFTARLEKILVIPMARDPAAARASKAPVLAVEGVQPGSRHPMEDGIRATPTTEPWIESNLWLGRSLCLAPPCPPLWIDHEPAALRGNHLRSVADAAMAGGWWVVAPGDDLRPGLFRRDPEALATWRAMGAYLAFAAEHAEWRQWRPYGNVGIVLDPAGQNPEVSNEYLNLVARRRVPYRVIERARLSAALLESFQAVLAADLAAPTEAERALLLAFGDKGGVVIAGPWWDDVPRNQRFVERRVGKGRLVVYQEEPPPPDAVARDLLELLEPEAIGLTAFNVPSVLTSVSTSGTRTLIQLLNYATRPFEGRITLRINGSFRTARFYTPEEAPLALTPAAAANGRTEVAIPRLDVWGAVLLERGKEDAHE